MRPGPARFSLLCWGFHPLIILYGGEAVEALPSLVPGLASSPIFPEITVSFPRFFRRIFVQRRGFSATAILLLAVAIGANTAVFSVANDVFLRPLSGVTAPDRLVALLRLQPDGNTTGFTYLEYLEYQTQARSFTDLVAYRGEDLWWQEAGSPVRLQVRLVSGGYFSLLGVRIAPGRDFLEEETRTPDTHPVVILTHQFWKTYFHEDSGIIGQSMRLNGVPFTIVGVAPESFRGLEVDEAPNLWIPLMMERVTHPELTGLDNGLWRVFKVVGRLKPNVGIEAAQAELGVVSTGIEGPSRPQTGGPRVVLRPDLRRPDPEFTASALTYLGPFVGVVLVLVAACANLMGLLLARLFARRREFALQMALGAHHRRLVAAVLAETLFLAGIGSGLGLFLARRISIWIQVHGDLHLDLSLDYRIAAFTALLAILAGSVIGLIPGMQATRADLVSDLRDQGGVPRRNRAYGILVSAQIAVALVLVSAAMLFTRTLRAVLREGTGFETENLLLAECDLGEAGYSDARAKEFFQTLTDRLNGLPGVLHVARATEVPSDRGWFSDESEVILGDEPGSERHRVQRARVTPGYLETLGVRLLAGRDFTAEDDSTAASVAIVNESMARTLWPDGDPLGQRFSTVFILRRNPMTVVGVFPELRSSSRESQARPAMLMPLAQHPETRQWVLVRAAGAAGDLASAIRDEIRQLDPDIPPPTVETAQERRVRIHSDERFYADLTGAYAFLGILFSTLGLFGILSLEVSQRSREVGLRMALGAQRRQVVWEVLKRGMTLALPGIAVGLLGALGFSRLFSGLLFGVTPWDPVSFAGAALLFLAVTVGVCIAPALRAGTVDPGSLLRSE